MVILIGWYLYEEVYCVANGIDHVTHHGTKNLDYVIVSHLWFFRVARNTALPIAQKVLTYSVFFKRGHAEFVWINNNIQSRQENKIFMHKFFCFCSFRCVYLRVYLLGFYD